MVCIDPEALDDDDDDDDRDDDRDDDDEVRVVSFDFVWEGFDDSASCTVG